MKINNTRTATRLGYLATGIASVAFLSACNGEGLSRPLSAGAQHMTGHSEHQMPATTIAAPTSNTAAAAAATQLNLLLQEHVYLAGLATGHALGGRTNAFNAAAAQLDANSIALSAMIGSVYGAPAQTAFLELWRRHITMFVDYTQAAATNNVAGKNRAIADLTAYASDFGAFLAAANPHLTQAAVASLLGPHVMTLTTAIDAQAAGNPAGAFAALRNAASHMRHIADPLAGALAKQFPAVLSGNPASAAASVRIGLNLLLQEHVYLAAFATGEALGGRTAGFNAAAAQLDANSIALAAMIGSVYGAPAQEAFLPLWRRHITMFVDYTQAAATNNQAGKTKALADLTAYAADFGAFLAAANPNLTQAAVISLLGPHVTTLTRVIDAQAAGDSARAYAALRESASHMQHIADPLAEAIVQQFPELFR